MNSPLHRTRFLLGWLGIALVPHIANAQATFNVADYGADPAPSTADDTAIHQALCDAVAANGTLFFPAGQWDLTNRLDLGAPGAGCPATPGRITLQGVGRASLLEYLGNSDAAIVYAPMGPQAQFTTIRDLSLRGPAGGVGLEPPSPITGAQGQSGIVLVSARNATITNVVLERFDRGYGIFLKAPVASRVTDNQVGASQIAIGLRTPNDVEVSRNSASTWAEVGILLFSDPADGATSRNNSVRENFVLGATLIPQNAPRSRAGIKIDGVGSTEISNNTVDRILAPSGAAGHAIWLTRTSSNLNQANQIRGNYLGPGGQGDGIRIADGLVSHVVIEGNQVGNYVIHDDGYNTVYQFQYVADLAQIVGTPHNRRGWVGLPTSVVQLH